MAMIRKQHSSQLKVKVALEALKETRTVAEISSKYGVHTTQIKTWKKKALEVLPEAFSVSRKKAEVDQAQLIEELYKQIGQLTVEVDWLKKKSELLV